MLTRETIRELAQHESDTGNAVSFYFQPSTPKDQSHREDSIIIKDILRSALRDAEKGKSKNENLRRDLDRILKLADQFHNNSGKAKAFFADSSKGIWFDFDLPPRLESTKVIVNSRFHLKLLAPLLEFAPRVCAVLVDRSRARLFDFTLGAAKEGVGFFNDLPRLGESDGFAGYDAGHRERHISESAKQHYKRVDETILKILERGGCDQVAFGCRDEHWAEIEPLINNTIRDRLLGRFRIDPSTASESVVAEGIGRLLQQRESDRRVRIVDSVVGEARRNRNGAVGLRRVLRSLESGEIQTLLIGDKFEAPGSECTNCGHIEFNANGKCALCEHKTRQLDDLSDSLIGASLRNGVEILYIKNDERLEKNGHIAALLRFRADQNTPMKLAS